MKINIILFLVYLSLVCCQSSKNEEISQQIIIPISENEPIHLLNGYYSNDSTSKYDGIGLISLSNPFEFHLGVEGIIKTVFCDGNLASVYFYPFNEAETGLYVTRLKDSLGIELTLGVPLEHQGRIIVYAKDSSYNQIFEEDNRILPPMVSWTDKRFIAKCPEIAELYKPDDYFWDHIP